MKKTKVKSKAYLIPMILIYLCILNTYYRRYHGTINIIKSEYESKIQLVEESILNEAKYTEIIASIAERDIQSKMEYNSNYLLGMYEDNPNVMEWNFTDLKDEFEKMDIYIIDENLNVVGSSSKEEVGLNLAYSNEFADSLKEILDGKEFRSDTMNFSIMDNELKKYSYMPTPDNKYLIEFSVTINKVYPELGALNLVYLSKDLEKKYSFIEDISIYKFNKNKEDFIDLYLANGSNEKTKEYFFSKKDRDFLMRKSLESNEVQQHTVMDKKDARYIMKYIPYSAYYEEYKSNWWASYAIEMVYNNNELIKSIFYQKKLFARSLATISILYFGFLFMIINLVQKNNETAYNDHLTKLPNRKKLEEVMEYKMIDANKKDIKIAILFFDLDKFKMINDEFGHNVGDKVLQEVANRIKNEIRKGDMICRLGGDEFVALISNISSKRSLEEIVERMSSLFKNSIKIDSEEIFIEASIGISIYPDHGDTIEELITKADKAMYEAKQRQIGYKIYKEKP